MIQQYIQTFQVAMQDRLPRRMQVVDAFGYVKGELLAMFPSYFDLHVVEQAPQRTSLTVFEHDAEVGCFGTGAQKEHYVRVTDDLHHSALVLEFFELFLLYYFFFDFLDSHYGKLPLSLVDETVATFGDFLVVGDFCERNLIVLDEGTCLVAEESGLAAANLLLDEDLF